MNNESILEELLADAGIGFEVVPHCPAQLCVVCAGEDILRAA